MTQRCVPFDDALNASLFRTARRLHFSAKMTNTNGLCFKNSAHIILRPSKSSHIEGYYTRHNN